MCASIRAYHSQSHATYCMSLNSTDLVFFKYSITIPVFMFLAKTFIEIQLINCLFETRVSKFCN